MSEPGTEVGALVNELELAAEGLRKGELDADEAAGLVDRCAELAAQLAAELDRQARELEADSLAPGQERLL
ncbi:MAG: hypothetical protein H0U42_10670 [Thermoleophilaceae bacterium]|nr:hypothetical protein [Thermoleophilaceae bacterium]